jgi:Zn-dependent protease with chaperone function
VSAPSRAERVPARHLRHPAEMPFYVFMVLLNVVIIAAIIRFALVLPFLPERLQGSAGALAVKGALWALLLFIPGLVIVRETQRAAIRANAVQLSAKQYPDLYAIVQDFAGALSLRRRPDIFLANGNGTLNAFAAQAAKHDYVVVANELFANLYNGNREGLRFILGHEVAHIRLHHVSFWYQLSVAYSQPIPLLGSALSRMREYSCDRHGAFLEPGGASGLVLLASGRYTQDTVDVDELIAQAHTVHGFWVGLATLPRSHPFTVRRLETLYRLGLFRPRVGPSVGAQA